MIRFISVLVSFLCASNLFSAYVGSSNELSFPAKPKGPYFARYYLPSPQTANAPQTVWQRIDNNTLDSSFSSTGAVSLYNSTSKEVSVPENGTYRIRCVAYWTAGYNEHDRGESLNLGLRVTKNNVGLTSSQTQEYYGDCWTSTTSIRCATVATLKAEMILDLTTLDSVGCEGYHHGSSTGIAGTYRNNTTNLVILKL